MKSPTAFWNHRGLDLQKKRGSVLVRQHWKQGGIVHSARAHLQAFRDRSSLTHTSMSLHVDDIVWCYSAPLVTLQGGGLWQCCHIFHCPLVTSRLVAAPLYQLVRLHQSSNLVIEKTGFSWTSPTVYTHITCMCLCLLCLHGEMLPDVIQLQALYGIFWVSGFRSLSWAEVPLNFTLKLLL